MEELDNYLKKIEQLISSDGSYKFEAYSFVLAALHHTVSKYKKPRHVSGKQLLKGIREYACDQYGPMARTVLNHWGIYKTEDFGKIVFALVNVGILRKQSEDKIEDFKDVFDFEEVFDKGYKIKDE